MPQVDNRDVVRVWGRVQALKVEHVEDRNGIWVLFNHEDPQENEQWYIDFFDENSLTVVSELQLLRDAMLNNLRTRLGYTEDTDHTFRLLQTVRIDR